MYLPRHFEISDWQEIVDFVSRVRAADLVTVDSDRSPVSTLMPGIWNTDGVVNEVDDFQDDSYFGTLYVHMARANKQWKSIKTGDIGLAIFHGEQAYISPSNYAEKNLSGKVVPTWNYNAVHLSGPIEVSEESDYVRKVVLELSQLHEAQRQQPWDVNDIPESHLEKELQGIVAITMKVTKVEAKAKLSQNRNLADRLGIVADLGLSHRYEDRAVSDQMRKLIGD
jgi:transcriptional regulator